MKLILMHQHDPTIPHVSGIGTFLNTFIGNAPEDLEIELLGVSADAQRYSVGRWHECVLGSKRFLFFPLANTNPVHVPVFPLTISMLLALRRYRRHIDTNNAILEFHRVEYMLGFIHDENPKVLFLHGNNMKDFYNKKTEVRWGKFPWLYFALERRLLPQAEHVYIVREDAVLDYQERYPTMAAQIDFLPTWVDDAVFLCLEGDARRALRAKLLKDKGCANSTRGFLFVGRYEGQKDPLRLLRAFKKVSEISEKAVLFLIGEGSLKGEMQDYVRANQLTAVVHFLPPMLQQDIARWMNAADALCLSSAFEGMPRVVVEALHCGLPVVSTAVGEAERLIGDASGGRLVRGDGADVFATAMLDLLDNPPSADACRNRVRAFTASQILAPVYHRYRDLSSAIA